MNTIISPDTALLNSYIEILEKTNQQLSLWYNPYGIMVAVLAILFAILAIVTAYVIYRQSRDYKKKLEGDRKFYKEKMEEFLNSQKKIIEERSETVKELSKKIDDIVDEYKKRLEKSSKKQKNEIQKEIDKLEIEKLSLKRDIGPITVAPNNNDYAISVSGIGLNSTQMHKCSHCGFTFYIDTDGLNNATTVLLGRTVICPKCQNIDNIF